ncbi:TetR/AcrR family transcriptional regulator [Actinomadura sp. NAK00032]|uniref:TetR/AcrR family transcriptional regulator n=1 Tax=Actinomadura sp. NAK00032 TaxID=2742128 RepID=UPI0015902E3A|nr:TetR/AcrR family transcriptional regulator [Actinomadura sp. NAK00032]QKW37061.1 TetR/AcrR family transcriptional regulator [Actinomadura sp. NAK00032]
MTSPRPYHHGNLRQAVLDRAAVKLREKGAAELSLRELTGEIGVSHAAPRRYFPDRQALLDALAAEGFARLGARLREAASAADAPAGQIRSIANAYIGFTAAEPNLVELMFSHKHGAAGVAIAHSAVEAFAPILEVFQHAQAEDGSGAERASVIFLATFQGLAGLISCGVVRPDQVKDLIADAVARFTGPHAERSDESERSA